MENRVIEKRNAPLFSAKNRSRVATLFFYFFMHLLNFDSEINLHLTHFDVLQPHIYWFERRNGGNQASFSLQ